MPAASRNGTPGGIRTPDHQVRSLVLYPAELRAHAAMVTHCHCAVIRFRATVPQPRRSAIAVNCSGLVGRAGLMHSSLPAAHGVPKEGPNGGDPPQRLP